MNWVYALCVVYSMVEFSQGHGRLLDPPSRSSMWRYGFKTKPNYNDNQLNCGGLGVQWSASINGKCGLCGDSYDQPQPRDNEGGGIYGQGVISRRYTKGQIITAVIQITANHKGYFTFSVCPKNKPLTPATEACFDDYPLQLADGSGTKWKLKQKPVPEIYKIALRLPPNLECWQCVFRWKWRAGNNWGEEHGVGGIGLGNQEHFFGCADISISQIEITPTTKEQSTLPEVTTMPVTTGPPSTPVTDDLSSTVPAVTTASQACRAVGVWRAVPGFDGWCVVMCEANPKCPYFKDHCCCHPYCRD